MYCNIFPPVTLKDFLFFRDIEAYFNQIIIEANSYSLQAQQDCYGLSKYTVFVFFSKIFDFGLVKFTTLCT